MKCQFELDDAFQALSGDVASERSQAMRVSMEICAHCADLAHQAAAARRIWRLAAPPEPDAPTLARLDRAVASAIRAGTAPAAPISVWWPRAMLAAAAAAAVLVVVVSISAVRSTGANGHLDLRPRAVALEAGDALDAGEDTAVVRVSNATVTLEAGAVGRLVRRTRAETRIEIQKGTAVFDVDTLTGDAVFRVAAREVLVTVRGTRFTVAVDDDAVEVTVDHGRVVVSRGAGKERVLGDGERVRLDHRAPPTPPRTSAAPPASVLVGPPDVLAPSRALPRGAHDPPARPAHGPSSPLVARRDAPVRSAHGGASPEGRDKAARPPARVKARRIRRGVPGDVPPADGADRRDKDAPAGDPRPPPRVTPKAPTLPGTGPRGESPPPPSGPRAVEITDVRAERENDPARRALQAIVARIDVAPPAESIRALQGWLRLHPSHVKAVLARYSVGYCEYRRGNKKAAFRIFSALPKRNPWIRKVGDYERPPRPR